VSYYLYSLRICYDDRKEMRAFGETLVKTHEICAIPVNRSRMMGYQYDIPFHNDYVCVYRDYDGRNGSRTTDGGLCVIYANVNGITR
jgi:hypothetical protein